MDKLVENRAACAMSGAKPHGNAAHNRMPEFVEGKWYVLTKINRQPGDKTYVGKYARFSNPAYKKFVEVHTVNAERTLIPHEPPFRLFPNIQEYTVTLLDVEGVPVRVPESVAIGGKRRKYKTRRASRKIRRVVRKDGGT